MPPGDRPDLLRGANRFPAEKTVGYSLKCQPATASSEETGMDSRGEFVCGPRTVTLQSGIMMATIVSTTVSCTASVSVCVTLLWTRAARPEAPGSSFSESWKTSWIQTTIIHTSYQFVNRGVPKKFCAPLFILLSLSYAY